MADDRPWPSHAKCPKCEGPMYCQRWGGDDGGDIRVVCLKCGYAIEGNRKDPSFRKWYVPPG